VILTPSVQSLVRACAASGLAAMERTPVARVVTREWSRDSDAQWLTRTATEPLTMADAPGLVRMVVPDVMATLVASSAAARLFNQGIQLSFDRAGQIAVPTILGDSTWATFVKDGDPVPVQEGHAEPLVILRPHKLAVIVVMTVEMLRSSNLETLMTDALIRSAGVTLDKVLFDDQPEDDTRPAGLRYGIAETPPSSAPDPLSALMQDIENLHREVSDVTYTQPIFVASHTRALMAHLRSTHGLVPLLMLGSQALKGTMLMLAVSPMNLASIAEGVPVVSASRAGTLQMDTQPQADIAGAAPLRSMFQTDCVAILIKLPVTWGVRSSVGVSWTVTTNW
jgi:hypothetical protein